MIQNNYYFFPIWQGEAWLDKPPLIPLLYASVANAFYFITPEISTRIFTLFISIIILSFVYTLYNKLFKDQILATLAVATTAFSPIFLQRAQVINLDAFLLLGWLGYVLFFDRKFLSLFFLFIAVFSKSLIGFYPIIAIAAYYIYIYFLKKVNKKEFKKTFLKLLTHSIILIGWFISMFIMVGKNFWQQHIIESHFRRVTSSIEFHFGQRTFYLDLVKEQYDFILVFIALGIFAFVYWLWKNKFDASKIFYGLYLLPWFLFLNATKTKIFWYLYAAIPQFGFFAAAPGLIFKKNKWLYLIFSIVLALSIGYKAFAVDNFFGTYYSKQEPHYNLALYARDRCDSLNVLLNEQSRKSFDELENQGLLITTTKWWGSHPSMVYYFGKKINFLYSEKELMNSLSKSTENSCFVSEQSEKDLIEDNSDISLLKSFDNLQLYK
jgi:4-amino-4-deoxy-L-arabinose transferase-like glycosyltransferase